MAVNLERLEQLFYEKFAGTPELIARAPGRVNLIGEHTDYNQGYVLPVALGFDLALAARARADHALRLFSVQYDDWVELSLDHLGEGKSAGWARYVAGIFDQFLSRGLPVSGIDAVVSGDVPLGAGLSSSAALGCATTLALAALFDVDLSRPDMARLCLDSEINYVGLSCGIMDQFISMCGKAGHALFLDCRDDSYELIPFPAEPLLIAVSNTLAKRGLTESAYNQRVAECRQGERLLSQLLGRSIRSLRDVTWEEFVSVQASMPETVGRRCRHVISENARTLRSVEAFRCGDLAAFGREMDASHASLRDDYAVSCRELDELVELAHEVPGVLGSRMTGGGFGGCTVSLLHPQAEAHFRAHLTEGYRQAFGRAPEIYVCTPSDGASVHRAG
ncbi:galactokinase [bacterium]|nr:galactokinase [bacterium]